MSLFKEDDIFSNNTNLTWAMTSKNLFLIIEQQKIHKQFQLLCLFC